jgi:hypothetical protein
MKHRIVKGISKKVLLPPPPNYIIKGISKKVFLPPKLSCFQRGPF